MAQSVPEVDAGGLSHPIKAGPVPSFHQSNRTIAYHNLLRFKDKLPQEQSPIAWSNPGKR